MWDRGEPARQWPTERQARWGGSKPGTRPSAVDIFSPNASPFLFAFPSSRRRLSQKAGAGSAGVGQDPGDPFCLATPSKVTGDGVAARGSLSALLRDLYKMHHPREFNPTPADPAQSLRASVSLAAKHREAPADPARCRGQRAGAPTPPGGTSSPRFMSKR